MVCRTFCWTTQILLLAALSSHQPGLTKTGSRVTHSITWWFFCQKACPDLLSYHDSYCVGGQIDLQSEMFIVRNRILISCYNVTHNPFCGPYW